MKKIITISREYGSGGRTVGKLVAEALGYSYYDSQIIDMAAKDSGLSAEYIAKNEQNLQSGWLYNLLLGSSYAFTAAGGTISNQNPVLPLADQVFNAQRKVIIELARKESCVIVGRCADFILSNAKEINRSDLLNVFVYAEEADKVIRAVEKYSIPQGEAKKTVAQIDKRRATHYNTFTENVWGDRKNYDLMVNSSSSGIQGAADFIVALAKM